MESHEGGVFSPDVTLPGSVFYFTQALWKKCQELGLAMPYKGISPVRTFIKRLNGPSLHPQWPHRDHVRGPRFNSPLRTLPRSGHSGQGHVDRGKLVPSRLVCLPVQRANKQHVEGWHQRLNELAGSRSQPFYVSVPLLHREAETVRRQVCWPHSLTHISITGGGG